MEEIVNIFKEAGKNKAKNKRVSEKYLLFIA